MNDWIEWNGGKCPVDENAIVKYRLRCGSTDTATANDILWDHFDAPYDVIAYRLHNQNAATSEQPKPKQKQDMVNNPPHYQSDSGVECIDAIRAALGRDGFIAYCRGNAMKYIWRDKLDNVEDWNKAVWYLNKAIEAKSE